MAKEKPEMLVNAVNFDMPRFSENSKQWVVDLRLVGFTIGQKESAEISFDEWCNWSVLRIQTAGQGILYKKNKPDQLHSSIVTLHVVGIALDGSNRRIVNGHARMTERWTLWCSVILAWMKSSFFKIMIRQIAYAVWYKALLYFSSLNTKSIYTALFSRSVIKIKMSHEWLFSVTNAINVLKSENCAAKMSLEYLLYVFSKLSYIVIRSTLKNNV